MLSLSQQLLKAARINSGRGGSPERSARRVTYRNDGGNKLPRVSQPASVDRFGTSHLNGNLTQCPD